MLLSLTEEELAAIDAVCGPKRQPWMREMLLAAARVIAERRATS